MKRDISSVEINKLPKCIVDLILDYFTVEIKIVCSGNKPLNSINIWIYDPQWMKTLIHTFWKTFPESRKTYIFVINAEHGYLDNMKWLFKNKFPYDRWTFAYAAEFGNLDNMKWLLENKFPFDKWTFYYAARNGNLDNMKWLLENKFPFDESTFENAAKNGSHFGSNLQNLDNMKWLLENKFPYNKWVFAYAAENGSTCDSQSHSCGMAKIKNPGDSQFFNGNLENMKWLLENKFPYGIRTFICATENGSTCDSQSHSCGMAKIKNLGDYQFFNGSLENMKWLLENKFPYLKKTKERLIKLGLLNKQITS